MDRELTDQEIQYWALIHWANYIETGNISLSARDLVSSKQHKLAKHLTLEQVNFITRLRGMAKDLKMSNTEMIRYKYKIRTK